MVAGPGDSRPDLGTSPAPRGRAASQGLKVLQARLVRSGDLVGSTLSVGADVVDVEIADVTGVDDTTRLYVEVRWAGGSSCEPWDLRLEIGSAVVR
jgi:hypothetical protein